MNRVIATAFSFRVSMHAIITVIITGLCRDKFTKTPRRGRVETRNSPAFYAILTHSRAKRHGSIYRVYPSSLWGSGARAGTFDMRVFTNRTGPAVGKLHIRMYARGPLPATYAAASVYRVILVPSHGPAVVCSPPHSS